MVVSFRKGLIRAVKFYAVMALIALGAHSWLGWECTFLPPPGVLPITVAVIVGLLWAILNVTDLTKKSCRTQSVGELTVHGAAFLLAWMAIVVFKAL